MSATAPIDTALGMGSLSRASLRPRMGKALSFPAREQQMPGNLSEWTPNARLSSLLSEDLITSIYGPNSLYSACSPLGNSLPIGAIGNLGMGFPLWDAADDRQLQFSRLGQDLALSYAESEHSDQVSLVASTSKSPATKSLTIIKHYSEFFIQLLSSNTKFLF